MKLRFVSLLLFAAACHQGAVSLEDTEHEFALTGTATYDTGLQVPVCGSGFSECFSGTLLVGRANVGPEPNYPNTIHHDCSDQLGGAFHTAESIDSLDVATTNGTNLQEGRFVQISASVWIWDESTDRVDFFYTGTAASPAWTFLSTSIPAGRGQQSLNAFYTLPTGATQAIRAVLRNTGSGGTPSICPGTTNADQDDLAFAVGAASPDTVAPTVSITSPANGATVSGNVTIAATASDNVAVTKVEFYVDSVLKYTSSNTPYTYSWTTAGVAAGSHALVAKAYDAANNVGTSATVTVTTTASGCSGTITTELLATPGSFEFGHNYWVESPYGIINNVSPPYAVSGSWKAQLRGYGFSGQDTLTLTNGFDLPFQACTSTFSFYASISTAEPNPTILNDTLVVELTNTSGTVISTLITLSNANASSGYVKYTVDTSSMHGSAFKIRFRGNENASMQTRFLIDLVSYKYTH